MKRWMQFQVSTDLKGIRGKTIFHDVDSLGRRYLSLGSSLCDLRAIDLVAAKGEVCSRCGGPATLIKRGKVAIPGRWKWVKVCVVCRELWDGEHFEILKRWVQECPTSNGIEGQLVCRIDEWRLIRPIVETRARKDEKGRRFLPGRWDFSVASWLIYTQPLFHSYEKVCEQGAERIPSMGDIWTPKRVRDGIRKVRGVIRRRGVEAGVMSDFGVSTR